MFQLFFIKNLSAKKNKRKKALIRMKWFVVNCFCFSVVNFLTFKFFQYLWICWMDFLIFKSILFCLNIFSYLQINFILFRFISVCFVYNYFVLFHFVSFKFLLFCFVWIYLILFKLIYCFWISVLTYTKCSNWFFTFTDRKK